ARTPGDAAQRPAWSLFADAEHLRARARAWGGEARFALPRLRPLGQRCETRQHQCELRIDARSAVAEKADRVAAFEDPISRADGTASHRTDGANLSPTLPRNHSRRCRQRGRADCSGDARRSARAALRLTPKVDLNAVALNHRHGGPAPEAAFRNPLKRR